MRDLAPADEYFGQLRMSVLGIRNELNTLERRAAGGDRNVAAMSGKLAMVDDAMRDWRVALPARHVAAALLLAARARRVADRARRLARATARRRVADTRRPAPRNHPPPLTPSWRRRRRRSGRRGGRVLRRRNRRERRQRRQRRDRRRLHRRPRIASRDARSPRAQRARRRACCLARRACCAR